MLLAFISFNTLDCYHGGEDNCVKTHRRIELFLIIQNLNIKQVTHSLVVIEVEIVIHTGVGREAQQGEDCRNKNKLVQVQLCKHKETLL